MKHPPNHSALSPSHPAPECGEIGCLLSCDKLPRNTSEVPTVLPGRWSFPLLEPGHCLAAETPKHCLPFQAPLKASHSDYASLEATPIDALCRLCPLYPLCLPDNCVLSLPVIRKFSSPLPCPL